MKSLIFILLLSPLISMAQVEAGVNAGMMPWRPDFSDHPNQHFDIHGMGSVSAMYNFSFIKAGISYTRATLASTGTYGTLSDHLYFQGDPFNEVAAFVAWSHHRNRTDNYVGATLGGIFYDAHFGGIPPLSDAGTSGGGLGYGIFIGSTYRIWSGLCINVQLGASHASLGSKADALGVYSDFWYWPLSAGIHWKFAHYVCKTKEKM